jgi:VanZ family protein
MTPPEAERPRATGGGVFLIIALVYLATIFAFSHVPGQRLFLPIPIWDKLVHFLEYVPLGFLIAGWLVRRPWSPRTRLGVVAMVTVIALALGAGDELHQWFVPDRSATVGDAVADGLGGLLGATVGGFVLDPRRRGKVIPSGSRTT